MHGTYSVGIHKSFQEGFISFLLRTYLTINFTLENLQSLNNMKMKHLRFALLMCLILPGMAWSQINLVPIQEIQGWAGIFQPDSCNAGPNPVYLNDTVKIRGVVMVNGGVAITSSGARWIWLRDITASPSTPYGHITVRNPGATSPFDLNDAKAGDTIEVVGIVQEFAGAGTPTTN